MISEKLEERNYKGHISKIEKCTISFKPENGNEFHTTSNDLHHKKKLRRYLMIFGTPKSEISGICKVETLNDMVNSKIVDKVEVIAVCLIDEFSDGTPDIQDFIAL